MREIPPAVADSREGTGGARLEAALIGRMPRAALSDYWKAFANAGFSVARFEEPRITAERYHLAASPRELERSMARPYSVAFKSVT